MLLLCFLAEDNRPAELISLSGSLAAAKARQPSSRAPRLLPARHASLLSQGPDSDPSEVMSQLQPGLTLLPSSDVHDISLPSVCSEESLCSLRTLFSTQPYHPLPGSLGTQRSDLSIPGLTASKIRLYPQGPETRKQTVGAALRKTDMEGSG